MYGISPTPQLGMNIARARAAETALSFHKFVSQIVFELLIDPRLNLNGKVLRFKPYKGKIYFYIQFPRIFNSNRQIVRCIDSLVVDGILYSCEDFCNEVNQTFSTIKCNGIEHSEKGLYFRLR